MNVLICQCRNTSCEKKYEEGNSTSMYKGFCSQKCLYAVAKKHGYRKGCDVYAVLLRVNQLGNAVVDVKTKSDNVDRWLKMEIAKRFPGTTLEYEAVMHKKVWDLCQSLRSKL